MLYINNAILNEKSVLYPLKKDFTIYQSNSDNKWYIRLGKLGTNEIMHDGFRSFDMKIYYSNDTFELVNLYQAANENSPFSEIFDITSLEDVVDVEILDTSKAKMNGVKYNFDNIFGDLIILPSGFGYPERLNAHFEY